MARGWCRNGDNAFPHDHYERASTESWSHGMSCHLSLLQSLETVRTEVVAIVATSIPVSWLTCSFYMYIYQLPWYSGCDCYSSHCAVYAWSCFGMDAMKRHCSHSKSTTSGSVSIQRSAFCFWNHFHYFSDNVNLIHYPQSKNARQCTLMHTSCCIWSSFSSWRPLWGSDGRIVNKT